MKKILTFALAMVMCLTAFAGCGGSKDVKLDEVMNKINTEYKLNLKKIDDLNKYYQVSNDDVKQFAAEINSDSNAPVEIVLVEAKDSDEVTNENNFVTLIMAEDAEGMLNIFNDSVK